MKKSLIAFLSAFALSILFTFLPLITRAEFSAVLQSGIAESLSFNTLISTFFSLVGLAFSFAMFYFLGKRSKIFAVKSTILAVLLGAILGSVALFFASALLYRSYLEVYLSLAAGSAVSSIFAFFFPALTALLFAELKENKSNNSLAV